MKLVKFGDEALCVLLHAFLVLLYLALVVIASHHYEHGLSYPFSSSTQTAMSITVSVIAQTFGTLYLAALVLVTQRLSLIRDIHTRQTLTALHDKLSAWLGLGSSILTLVDQVRVPAAVSSVMFIALYLGGVAVLHIAIPASVSVDTYNATSLRSYPTKLARPYTLFGPEGNASHVLWDILRVYGQFPQVGLQDNLVYDVVPTIQSATKDVVVNATRFTADCGLVPDTIQTDFARDGGTTNQWVFNVNTNVSLQLDVPAPSQLSTKGTWYPLGDMNLNVIGITSTIPVVDATGANATSVAINPGLLYRMVPNSGPNQNVNWVQMLACNIDSENTTIAVSAINGAPITRPAAVQNDVVWKNWTVPQVPTDPLLLSISVVIPQSPDGAQDVGANGMYEGIYLKQTDGPYRWNSSEIDLVEPASTSALDDFIMQDLSTKQSSSDPSEWNAIQVTDLQLTLGKAIAAMVWYHRNGNHSNVFSYNAAWMLNEDRVGLADVEVAVLRLRLSFNVIPLAVGLGISCGLFLITFLLSRRPLRSEGSSKLRAIGILQLTWLLGNESHLVDVRKPDHQKLRKAGLFDVQMSARAQQKMSQVEEEYEASELTVLDESRDSDSDALCGYNR